MNDLWETRHAPSLYQTFHICRSEFSSNLRFGSPSAVKSLTGAMTIPYPWVYLNRKFTNVRLWAGGFGDHGWQQRRPFVIDPNHSQSLENQHIE
jgi:hypothetical protein